VRRRLTLAIVLSLVFMLMEIIGGPSATSWELRLWALQQGPSKAQRGLINKGPS